RHRNFVFSSSFCYIAVVSRNINLSRGDVCVALSFAISAILAASACRVGVAAPPDHEEQSSSSIVPLTAEQLDELLGSRLDAGMQGTFSQFANMFFVASRISLPKAVALATPSERVSEAELMSPFPSTYQPTLREFLDSIAMQTLSEWKYDPTDQYVDQDSEPP